MLERGVQKTDVGLWKIYIDKNDLKKHPTERGFKPENVRRTSWELAGSSKGGVGGGAKQAASVRPEKARGGVWWVKGHNESGRWSSRGKRKNAGTPGGQVQPHQQNHKGNHKPFS